MSEGRSVAGSPGTSGRADGIRKLRGFDAHFQGWVLIDMTSMNTSIRRKLYVATPNSVERYTGQPRRSSGRIPHYRAVPPLTLERYA